MAAGTHADLVIYQAEFQTGLVERLSQNIAAFNAATRNAIQLRPNALKGHYGKEAFFKTIAGLVTRRVISSVAAVSSTKFAESEVISVKIDRKVGPVEHAVGALFKAGLSEADASRAFGQLAADAKMADMLNTGLIAVERAIQDNTAMNLNITSESTKTASALALIRTLAKFGDASAAIICWVGHSKPYHDILAGMAASGVTGLADAVQIFGATPQTAGRPFVMTDAPALTDANGSAADTYNTLGLVEGGLIVEESEPDVMLTELVGGKEQITRRWQSEFSYNIKVKGFKYDTSVGVSPTDVNLGASSSWDQVATDDKQTAGVRLVTQ
jgi:hypothetical protein